MADPVGIRMGCGIYGKIKYDGETGQSVGPVFNFQLAGFWTISLVIPKNATDRLQPSYLLNTIFHFIIVYNFILFSFMHLKGIHWNLRAFWKK